MEINGFDEELIQRTISTWQEKYVHTISRGDAISVLNALAEVAENLVGWQVDTATNDALAEKRAS